jgi:uncharacterized membrane protein YebE (DUF533 family)
MSMQNLLNQFLGATGTQIAHDGAAQTLKTNLSNMAGQIPGGLVGGAAAGGILALLVSNKSARKFAGTAASYGGAALLGGLAYKAYKNWQHVEPAAAAPQSGQALSEEYQLLLVKAMIAAAAADGHIDQQEQQRIFRTIEQMEMSTEMKGVIFDLLQRPVPLDELAGADLSMEQKSELYLASCLIVDVDHREERLHLDRLAAALQLPGELAAQLESQAQTVVEQAA